jgi:hypothetical protein
MVDLEAAPIGSQLFSLGGSQSDCTASAAFLDTYATRLLAQALSSFGCKASLALPQYPALRHAVLRSSEYSSEEFERRTRMVGCFKRDELK